MDNKTSHGSTIIVLWRKFSTLLKLPFVRRNNSHKPIMTDEHLHQAVMEWNRALKALERRSGGQAGLEANRRFTTAYLALKECAERLEGLNGSNN